MGLFVSTTGTDVPIPELGITISHPTTDLQLDSQFSAEEIKLAEALTAAIVAGTLVWRKVAAGAIEIPADYDPEFIEAEKAATGTGNSNDRVVRFSDLPNGSIAFATPVAVGSANAPGSASTFSRSDHVHAHSNQGGGTLHAEATQAVAGFLSAADKTKLDNSVAGPSRFTIVSTFNGAIGNNQWFGYNELLPGNTTPIVIPIASTIKEISLSFNAIGVDGNLVIYKNGIAAGNIVATLNLVNVNNFTTFTGLNIPFAAGDQLRGRWTDTGDNPNDLAIVWYLQTT